ncbi:MAG: hypothetical protein A2284_04890 [Deltaproteobacteria bacterium RIFOXYA12_FULL_61_11]|nr:MAG: hypothetical protein A2284_04890 [Deltaproteobacteria bacterium RIFOXYA12_FULL_61_11]
MQQSTIVHDLSTVSNRRRILDRELERCLNLLLEHGDPEKVILFGTLAHGTIHEWSDIDLVVVEETSLPFFRRLKRLRKLLRPRVAMDIVMYTPVEFERLCAERSFFQEEILAKGKTLYEREN